MNAVPFMLTVPAEMLQLRFRNIKHILIKCCDTTLEWDTRCMSPGLKTNDNRNDLYQKVKTTTKYARRVPGGIDFEVLVQKQTILL